MTYRDVTNRILPLKKILSSQNIYRKWKDDGVWCEWWILVMWHWWWPPLVIRSNFLNIIPSKFYSRHIFSRSASLLRVTKLVLNKVFDLFQKNFFSLNPFLEMISKDDKISFYILKSKLAFETSLFSLSKLAEKLNICLL